MRIVHVVNSSEESIVGVEKHVLYLAIAQKARGSNVMMAIDHPGVFSEACHQHNIPMLVAEGLDPGDAPLGRLSEKTVRDLIAQFKSFDADVIHCHTLPSAAQAIPAANLSGTPCVITFNAAGPLIQAKKAGMRFITICVSKDRFEDMKKSDLPEGDIYYVPNGTRAAPRSGPQRAHQPDHPELMSVGSLITRKGVENSILAMTALRRRRGPDCPPLNIYGDGSLREYLQEMVNVLELNDIVRLRGSQPGILEHCPSTDVLVVSSRWESGPLVVLEAMSRGMPIVTTDVGEVSEMLPDQRYGRVVPVNSIVPLADAIDSLLSDIANGVFDPEMLIERHRSRYTDEKMAERIDAVYEQALLRESAAV
jgi:glycosyltransferase involved in cell wall biosynthesis